MKLQSELYTIEEPLNVFASPKMIETLKKCYRMELHYPGKPYGPKDFKGSFAALYKRGLLDIDTNNKKFRSGKWYITNKGLQFLVYISTNHLKVSDPFLVHNMNKLQHNLEELQLSIYRLKVTSGRILKQDA